MTMSLLLSRSMRTMHRLSHRRVQRSKAAKSVAERILTRYRETFEILARR